MIDDDDDDDDDEEEEDDDDDFEIWLATVQLQSDLKSLNINIAPSRLCKILQQNMLWDT